MCWCPPSPITIFVQFINSAWLWAATICLQRTPITLGAQHVQGPNLEPISTKGTVINIHQEVANAFLTLHWMRSLFTLVSMIKLHRCTSLITSSCFSLPFRVSTTLVLHAISFLRANPPALQLQQYLLSYCSLLQDTEMYPPNNSHTQDIPRPSQN